MRCFAPPSPPSSARPACCGFTAGSPRPWRLPPALAHHPPEPARSPSSTTAAPGCPGRSEAEAPEPPGIPLDPPDRRDAARLLREARLDPAGPGPMEAVLSCRADAYTSANFFVLFYWAGEYLGTLPSLQEESQQSLSRGQLNRAARCKAAVAGIEAALGRLDDAK